VKNLVYRIKDILLLFTGTEDDFLSLELRNGLPLLRINSGSGELKLTVDGRDKSGHARLKKLNDGRWHRIDIFKRGKVIKTKNETCN